jgi:hypothetical protein
MDYAELKAPSRRRKALLKPCSVRQRPTSAYPRTRHRRGLGLSERREASFRVSFAASFPWASSCRTQAQSRSEFECLWGCFRVVTERYKGGIRRQNIEPEVFAVPSGIAGVFDVDATRRIVFAIEESRKAENPVAVRATEIAAKGDGQEFQGAFLLFESEAVNPPTDLVLTERCRKNRIWRGNSLGGPERTEAPLSISI